MKSTKDDKSGESQQLLSQSTDYQSGLDVENGDSVPLDMRLTVSFSSVVLGMLPLAAFIALSMSAW